MLSKSEIKTAIEKAPAVGETVRKLASKVAHDAQRELERLFGAIGQRTSDGRFYISIPPFFRERTVWREAFEYFGLAKEDRECDDEDVFARLKLMEPVLTPLIDSLAANEEVARFVARSENRKDWKRLFLSCVKRFSGLECELITTLSQLGSDWFGDSKKLRSGALRRQLVIIVAMLSDMDADDERLVLEGALIVDNPYTSSVTFSLPVTLIMKDGAVFDYPSRYHLRRMAVQLPLETVVNIERVEWDVEPQTITTSENAAPFANMVAKGVACVYTAGYPCLAVKVFLNRLSKSGSKCIHEGDADLDGFRIAKEVGNCIPLKDVVACDVLKVASSEYGRELSAEQIKRTSVFLSNPKYDDYEFADEIRCLIGRGKWIEQESFAEILKSRRVRGREDEEKAQ
jgi:copper chaperone CopZ